MKLLFSGIVNAPTGAATHHRNFLKALRKRGHEIQITDFFRRPYDTKDLYTPLDVTDEEVIGMLSYNPIVWTRDEIPPTKRLFAYCVHEGSKCPEGWGDVINKVIHRLIVPSKATKNLFMNSGVRVPISIVPEGIDPDIYRPDGEKFDFQGKENAFKFLYVGSWTLEKGDRKNLDTLIKAYKEEFTEKDNVILFLKISTFFMAPKDYAKIVDERYNVPRGMIGVHSAYMSETEIPKLFRMADCYVTATRGESWGLPIGEALACGLPVIVPENEMAGYMDFVPGNNFFVKTKGMAQAEESSFCEGNLMPIIDQKDLSKKMRAMYEMKKEERERLGKENSVHMRTHFTWDKAGEKFEEIVANS